MIKDTSKMRDKSAEACVLSSFINDNNLLAKHISKIKPYVFYVKIYEYIFRSMETLHHNHTPIDIVSINNNLKQETDYPEDKIVSVLNTLSDIIITPYEDSLLEYINTVNDYYKIRKYVEMSVKIEDISEGGTTLKKLKSLMGEYNVLPIQTSLGRMNVPETCKEILNRANMESESAIEKDEKRMLGIPTGIKTLSKYILLRPKNTYIIAGRPGHGKSSLAISMTDELIKRGYRVGILSLEMDKESLINKCISKNFHISDRMFGELHESEKIKLRKKLANIYNNRIENLMIDDSSFYLNDIKNSIYSMHNRRKLDLFIVDYLQLAFIEGFTGTDNSLVETISRELKLVATRLMIPGIILSQLNRGVEKRANKRPMLSDLRSSGAIEQDATSVISVYRAEEYGIKTDAKGRDTKGMAELGIIKNRYGKKGIIRVRFMNEYAYFKDKEINDFDFD